jgi:hypothetical protein
MLNNEGIGDEVGRMRDEGISNDERIKSQEPRVKNQEPRRRTFE